MPWTCPACQTAIRHEEDHPNSHRIYRCHVCRLELVVDQRAGKLTVAPLPTERPSDDLRAYPPEQLKGT
jgi:hypothetical protein